ncbi:MAG: hypothetical protein M0Z50_07015 [Planctomycetia bacterium]|nr:hypothetical protein [Planctomycetia bacterium]
MAGKSGKFYGLAMAIMLASLSQHCGNPSCAAAVPVPPGLTPKKDTRLPIPPSADQAEARRKIQQLFTLKYHALNNTTIGPFIQTLWSKFDNVQQYPVRCYVAMQLQLTLTTRTTAAYMARLAAQYLDAHYRVNGYALLVKSAQVMIHNMNVTRWQEQELEQSTLYAAKAAMKEQHYHSAAQLADISGLAAQRIADHPGFIAAGKVFRMAHGLAQLQKQYQQALTTLRANPANSRANQTVGLYLLANGEKGDKVGPYLARSNNDTLAKLGKLLTKNFNALPCATRFQMGDLFWKLRRKCSNYALADALLKQGEFDYDSGTYGAGTSTLTLLAQGHYHQTVDLLQLAIRGDRRLLRHGYTWFRNNVVTWKAALAQLIRQRRRYQIAMAQMTEGRANPKANQVLGEFYCLVEGRWKKIGLSFLVHSASPALAKAARLDRAAPTTPLGCKAVGDAWWRLAQQHESLERYNLLKRAAYWYTLAKPKLPTADRATILFRILRYKPGSF